MTMKIIKWKAVMMMTTSDDSEYEMCEFLDAPLSSTDLLEPNATTTRTTSRFVDGFLLKQAVYE
ncbi:CLUMA_CG003892, isoform A [Clunio marinus]|uniref:CLUMA_CG003892, isoform A n=1 Tax=Clunio marinus TaxID=568069 RepID=A0A1J1HRM4_9DIPT|nr:CLUMA_CG003892, isoform A [Clunio marinus]